MCITIGSTRGNWEQSTDVSLADDEKSLKYMTNLDPERSLVHPCIQPRGGPYCPPDLMAGLGEHREKYDAYVQGENEYEFFECCSDFGRPHVRD